MAFVITNIHFDELNEFEKKLLVKHQAIKNEKHKFKFRMFDDDGILYFEGLSSVSNTFVPLDDLGVSYGCTEIHYLINGKFEQL